MSDADRTATRSRRSLGTLRLQALKAKALTLAATTFAASNVPDRAATTMGMGSTGWSEGHILSIRKNDPTPLEAGMVFHLIPGIVIEGEALVSVSEPVIVTEAGAEPVRSVSRELAVR